MALVEIEIAMIMTKNRNIKPRMTLLEHRVRSDSWVLRRMNTIHRGKLNKMIRLLPYVTDSYRRQCITDDTDTILGTHA